MTKYKSPDFIKFVKSGYCVFCGGYDRWDGNNSIPINTPFHIKTRGSGGKDYYNTVAACTMCHIKNENNVVKKKSLIEEAVELTEQYFSLYPEKYEANPSQSTESEQIIPPKWPWKNL